MMSSSIFSVIFVLLLALISCRSTSSITSSTLTTPPTTTLPTTTAVPWGVWTYWSACDTTCGLGRRTRKRECQIGLVCQGDPPQERSLCSLGDCPNDVQWGPWGRWASCSTTCGIGQHTRTRHCPFISTDGFSACGGNERETGLCFAIPCFTTTKSTSTTITTTASTTSTTASATNKHTTKPTGPCVDNYPTCNTLGRSVCTVSTNMIWSRKFCARYCGFCNAP